MSNAGIPTRKRKRSELAEVRSSPPRSLLSPRSPSPRPPSAPHPGQQPAQSPPVYPSEEPTAQAGIDPAVVPSERGHTRASASATQAPLPTSANQPSSTKSHPHSQSFVQSWLESSVHGESPDQPVSTPASPQPAISQPVPNPVFPLTKFNLRHHCNPTMAGGSKSSDVHSSQPMNDARLRDLVKLNNILPHARNDEDTFPEPIKWGKTTAISKRVRMSDSSAKKAMAEREYYEAEPENSFLGGFIRGRLMKLDRQVEGQILDRAWSEDGVLCFQDRIWITDALKILTDNPGYDKRLHDPKSVMTIPKPDLSYGLIKSTFTIEEAKTIQHFPDFFMVCPSLISVFFLVECKSYNGSIDAAEEDKNGIDLRSRVFSMNINTVHARLNVHWISDRGGELFYHQHRIQTYNLEQEEWVRKLKSDVCEVFDWGTLGHRQKVEETLAALQGQPAPKVSSKDEKISQEAEGKKRKLDSQKASGASGAS